MVFERQEGRKRRPNGDAAAYLADLLEALVGQCNAGLASGEQLSRGCRRVDQSERVDDGTARQVSGLVSAHAVCDGPKPDLGTHQVGIFVALAHISDVGGGPGIVTRGDKAPHDLNPAARRQF